MIITNAWIRTLVHDNNLEVYVIMKFFIDTANVDYIKEANDMGIICGVTTNPSLIAKEGRVFEEVIAEIASIVDGPISERLRQLQQMLRLWLRKVLQSAKFIRTWL